jgi:hypothetical protein
MGVVVIGRCTVADVGAARLLTAVSDRVATIATVVPLRDLAMVDPAG